MLTKANVDDRNPEVFNRLSDNVFGKLYADKGYISQALFERMFDKGISIVTGLRCFFGKKPSINIDYCIENFDGQLSLFQ